MLRQCCCFTKKGRPCPINADRQRGRLWYCHVHDPEGKAVANARAVARSAAYMRLHPPKESPDEPGC